MNSKKLLSTVLALASVTGTYSSAHADLRPDFDRGYYYRLDDDSLFREAKSPRGVGACKLVDEGAVYKISVNGQYLPTEVGYADWRRALTELRTKITTGICDPAVGPRPGPQPGPAPAPIFDRNSYLNLDNGALYQAAMSVNGIGVCKLTHVGSMDDYTLSVAGQYPSTTVFRIANEAIQNLRDKISFGICDPLGSAPPTPVPAPYFDRAYYRNLPDYQLLTSLKNQVVGACSLIANQTNGRTYYAVGSFRNQITKTEQSDYAVLPELRAVIDQGRCDPLPVISPYYDRAEFLSLGQDQLLNFFMNHPVGECTYVNNNGYMAVMNSHERRQVSKTCTSLFNDTYRNGSISYGLLNQLRLALNNGVCDPFNPCPDPSTVFDPRSHSCVARCPDPSTFWDVRSQRCMARCSDPSTIWDAYSAQCIARCPVPGTIWNDQSQQCVSRCPDPGTIWNDQAQQCVSRCPDPNTVWNPMIGRCVARRPQPTPVPVPVPLPPVHVWSCSIPTMPGLVPAQSTDKDAAMRDILGRCAAALRERNGAGQACSGSMVSCI